MLHGRRRLVLAEHDLVIGPGMAFALRAAWVVNVIKGSQSVLWLRAAISLIVQFGYNQGFDKSIVDTSIVNTSIVNMSIVEKSSVDKSIVGQVMFLAQLSTSCDYDLHHMIRANLSRTPLDPKSSSMTVGPRDRRCVLVNRCGFVKLTTGIACGAVMAVSAQSVPAFGVSARSLTKTQSVEAEQSASALAGQALGLAAAEKLVVKDVMKDSDGSTHVRYNRTFNGLRVIGGDLVSHRDQTGEIKSVNWNDSGKVAVSSTTPKVALASAKAAGARTASAQHTTTLTSKGELVVYAVGAIPKLAYDVLTEGVRADHTPSRLHTIVDAVTGAPLTTWDEIETGTGRGIFVGAVPLGTTAGLIAAGPAFSMLDAAGNLTTDLNGSVSATDPGITFTDADDIWGNGLVSDRASAGVDAQYGAEKTFEYYKSMLGRNGIWNTGVGARSRVHYGSSYDNAFWDGSQMTYGDGLGNTHPLVEIDVAGHEMTHGVTQNTAALVYSGEAGGLNEATSDILATAVEWFANNRSDTPDYLLGERLNLHGDGTPLRYMDQPSKDHVSADCWSPSLHLLDPHRSSGPLNHWFYLASEGSGAKVIRGVSYNSPTCNASTVAPIGRDIAAKIWYRTLTTYLTSTSTYASAREGAIKSAKDLFGVASPQCKGVAASFSAIGVPAGRAKC